MTDDTPLVVSQTAGMTGRKYPKIMVVDDDARARLVLRLMLEKAKFRVVEAASAELLLTSVFDEDVDLVLLDVKLGGMSGIDACRALKRNVRRERDIPVIFVSGLNEQKSVIEAVRAGADGFVLKPVTAEVLLGKVRALLGIPEERRSDEEP